MRLEDLLYQPSDDLRLLGKVIKALQYDFNENLKAHFAMKLEKIDERSLQIVLVKRSDNPYAYFDFFKTDGVIPLTVNILPFRGRYQICWAGLTVFTIALISQDHVKYFFTEIYDTGVDKNITEEQLIEQGFAELESMFKSNKRSGAA